MLQPNNKKEDLNRGRVSGAETRLTIARNRVGPLSAQSTSIGGRVGARGGHFQHHDASFTGDTPATQARA